MARYIAVMSCLAAEYAKCLPENIEVLFLPPDTSIDDPVSSHPDMILCAVGKQMIVSEGYYKEHQELFEYLALRTEFSASPSCAPRGKKYPFDIAFNVLTTPRHIFSLTEHTAPEIIAEAERSELISVRVKQGYAACSSLIAGACIISADPSILKAASEHGYDTLAISEGNILLDGYAHGFIGGASGVCGNSVYFLGNIMRHPDGEKIRGKLASHGFDIVSLSDYPLTDFGGIKFFSVCS